MIREPEGEGLEFGAVLPESEAVLRSAPEPDGRDGLQQAQLVERCLAGDETAFATIAELYGNLLLRTAYLIVRDEETAKDIVQESLLLAWRNLGKLREPSYLRAWLLKIVVNQSMSLKRQLARKTALLRAQLLQQQIDTTVLRADLERGRIEETLDVLQAIGRLPLSQRAVLVLFYYHRMTMPEIAEMLGVGENTLRKRLQAALQKVRRVLQSEARSESELEDRQSQISVHRGNVQ